MCNIHILLAQHSRCANPQTQVEALQLKCIDHAIRLFERRNGKVYAQS